MSSTRVELDTARGSVLWSVAVNSAQEPDLVAEGDLTGDGIPDYVVDEIRPLTPKQECGGRLMSEGQLLFIDGATAAASHPVPPTPDVCWSKLGYATHQWGVGTAYIGRLSPGGGTAQLVVFPYYATAGWVLAYEPRIGWRRVSGATDRLVYPSTPEYDSVYNTNNATRCAGPETGTVCYVENSHVPNAVFLGAGAQSQGLFVLTSDRALIYGPDFAPTSDFVWSYAEGSGRNYGLVESNRGEGGDQIVLIGGCSVAKTRDAMRLHELSGDPCALLHHYEYFLVDGRAIVQHAGRFFGWSGTDGPWQNRLEFPFPSLIPLTGSLWTVFNLYRDGEWRAMLLPDSSDPARAIEEPGWYVWGSVSDMSGHTYLAATRTRATSATSIESYIPPWDFDILAWRNGGLVSVAHYQGLVPSLALAPPGETYHTSDGDPFGLMSARLSRCGPNELLVETAAGRQTYVPIPQLVHVC